MALGIPIVAQSQMANIEHKFPEPRIPRASRTVILGGRIALSEETAIQTGRGIQAYSQYLGVG